MENELLFRFLLLLYYVCIIGINVFYGRRARQSGRTQTRADETAVRREGRGKFLLRRISGGLMILGVLLYVIYPGWMAALAAPLPLWLRWLGVALGLSTLPLLVWVQQALGRHWSRNLQLQAEHQLITTGPYARIRHPMYLVIIASFVTVALLAANWLVILPAVGAIAAVYARIQNEEQMLVDAFPEAYPAYMQRTGRLLPRRPR
ncbi:MAG: isoprenylcysteine carboxylmethyltransferase family protein [Anaerolineales bacterium]|nr:isoprenylcysteine carboxylmethyltransferase family protein [Anaerolineales bacterium]